MIGYKRGRFTAIDSSGWCKDNPDKFEILKIYQNIMNLHLQS